MVEKSNESGIKENVLPSLNLGDTKAASMILLSKAFSKGYIKNRDT